MKSALSALMPAHHSLLQIAAAHVAHEDYAGEQFAPGTLKTENSELNTLKGQPQLVAIAQLDRDLALTLKRLINELEEGDFSEAAHTSDELSHRIRTNYLASLSDASGIVKH